MNALLIDDHPLILSAMQALVHGLGPHVRAVGVETPDEAYAYLVDHLDVDIVLLDLRLGVADGFDVLAELRSRHPMLPVVIVSASESPADVIRALDSGAMGFVPKRASNEMLFEALHMVLSGGLYVPPLLTQQAMQQPTLSEPSRSAMLDEAGAADQVISPGSAAQRMPASSIRDDARAAQALFDTLGLTPRQLEVLRLLLQGQPNKLIARELGLSVETIKDHVAAVLRALGVNSRTQAVLAVNQMLQRDSRNEAQADGRDRGG